MQWRWVFKKKERAKENEWREMRGRKRKRKLEERRQREVREKSQKRVGERGMKKLWGAPQPLAPQALCRHLLYGLNSWSSLSSLSPLLTSAYPTYPHSLLFTILEFHNFLITPHCPRTKPEGLSMV